jgi:hypothetical protein
MAEPLQGVTRQQQRELRAMLARLSALWSALTVAAASRDQARVDAINREIAVCRQRVEAIKRTGTAGTA